MPDHFANPWRTLNSQVVYDNHWITVQHDEVLRPDGQEGIYGVVRMKNVAVAVLPLDAGEQVHLVGQYRYTLDCYSWELPEGGAAPGEDPLEAAQRELVEETGLTAAEWIVMGKAHLSNSITDESAIYYLARQLQSGPAQPEGTELLQHRTIPLDEAVEMVLRDEITDCLSRLAILHYAARRESYRSSHV